MLTGSLCRNGHLAPVHTCAQGQPPPDDRWMQKRRPGPFPSTRCPPPRVGLKPLLGPYSWSECTSASITAFPGWSSADTCCSVSVGTQSGQVVRTWRVSGSPTRVRKPRGRLLRLSGQWVESQSRSGEAGMPTTRAQGSDSARES